MKKNELLKKLSEKSGLTQTDVNCVLNAFTEIVVSEVRDNDEDVTLVGLGTFKCKHSSAREGRNPMTGEKVKIKASRTIQFKVQPSVKVQE